MPELDPFETRLTAAVQAFADRAQTGVDATAVAARSVRRRHTGAFAWLWSPLPVPAGILLTVALLLALLAWTFQAGAPWDRRTSVIPPTAPTATPSVKATPVSQPTVTPVPPTDGAGAGVVRGTETVSPASDGTTSRIGAVTQVRGVIATTVDAMNDPRVTGTGTMHGANDAYGSVGPQWGTYRLENAKGAWEGTWTGALSSSGTVSQLTAWLVGSGAYEGHTYYVYARGTNPLAVDGVIFEGSPPAP